ncbi:TonB-dependent receptor [Chryseosolibacter indicus]|uniref:TonB-dependent siderophore receptor n=1 Tax=Chryseosolibacter indicus TaxID=2782351 RepID=A0ABS5VXH1_9BACT|nr:TonB-dependent receptor [Chryseosolibacter indicus]MBT1706026.1 TonB-dependent siderophore receptor [Chryseosolibacter indicus]
MNRILYLFFFLISTGTILAQTGNVSGSVKTSDGQPASFVNVYLKGANKGTITDTEGNFEITKVKPGNYTLVASFVGLQTQTQTVDVKDNQTTEASFTLEEDGQELKEVVISADPSQYVSDYPSISLRLKTPLIETPQNIQVVNAQVIKDQQIFDMREGIIRNVSGATASEHWETYARIVMRGARIASFRNGMNVTSSWGPLTEDMSMVERIEFVKGPAGFMLAAGEPSGFYNVVTKKPTGVNKGEVGMTIGSYGTYRGTLDLDGKLSKDGKLLYRLNLMGQQKGTQRSYEFNDRVSIAPVIKYQINKNTSLTAEYTLQHVKMSPIGSSYSYSANKLGDLPTDFTTLEPNMRATTAKDQSLFLTFSHGINDNWKFTGQIAYQRFDQVGESLWPAGFTNGVLVRGMNNWDVLGTAKVGQFFVNGDVETGKIKHRILAGIDMGDNSSFQDYWQFGTFIGTTDFDVYNPVYGTVPGNAYPVFDRSLDIRERGAVSSTQYSALYIQDELHLFDEKLRLTLAGRYTNTDDNGYAKNTIKDKFTPRLGVSYSINSNTSAYAVYDQSFIPQSGVNFEKEPFDPLTGNNMEVGLKKEWLNGQWTATISLYQITKNNVLTGDPEHQNYSIQIGETQTQGLEFDIRGQIVEGLNVTMNYAYTDGKITKDTDETMVDRQIPGTDKHIANAWISYRVPLGVVKGLGIAMGVQHAADRTNWYGAYYPTVNSKMPSYTRFDAALSYQFEKLSIGLNVNNIFDAELISGSYFLPSNFYFWQSEALRNYRLSVSYKF